MEEVGTSMIHMWVVGKGLNKLIYLGWAKITATPIFDPYFNQKRLRAFVSSKAPVVPGPEQATFQWSGHAAANYKKYWRAEHTF